MHKQAGHSTLEVRALLSGTGEERTAPSVKGHSDSRLYISWGKRMHDCVPDTNYLPCWKDQLYILALKSRHCPVPCFPSSPFFCMPCTLLCMTCVVSVEFYLHTHGEDIHTLHSQIMAKSSTYKSQIAFQGFII